MEQFTSLRLTCTSVAKVRALEYVAIWALCSLITVAIHAKVSAYWIGLGVLGVHEWAGVVAALAFGIMQTQGGPFFRRLMGKITIVTILATVLQ